MSGTSGIVYYSSVGEGVTLRSPYLTMGWIRNVGGVGRRVDHFSDLLWHTKTPKGK
jgi:hypothetical protein